MHNVNSKPVQADNSGEKPAPNNQTTTPTIEQLAAAYEEEQEMLREIERCQNYADMDYPYSEIYD